MPNMLSWSGKGLFHPSMLVWLKTEVEQASDLLEIVKRKRDREISVGIAPEQTDDIEMTEAAPSSSPEVELRKNDFKSSTKLNALTQHLRAYTSGQM